MTQPLRKGSGQRRVFVNNPSVYLIFTEATAGFA
jgi:hypothetical protein